MSAGYEDQLPQGSDNGAWLRDAFAQLLAQQPGGQAVPQEAVWQQQGRDQFPAPMRPQAWDLPPDAGNKPGDFAVMPQRSMDPRGMNFPQAQPGPGAPNIVPPPQMPPVPQAQLPPERDPAPFHGKGQYVIPKSPKKKPKAKDKD
jgi:hypothetical protein